MNERTKNHLKIYLKCGNCKYVWLPIKENPKRCPDCGISKKYGKFKRVGKPVY